MPNYVIVKITCLEYASFSRRIKKEKQCHHRTCNSHENTYLAPYFVFRNCNGYLMGFSISGKSMIWELGFVEETCFNFMPSNSQ